MKNVSKYMMMLAVVALGFTACEDEIKRDPSPEFDGKKSIFFPLSETALEVDPKDAFEYEVMIVRTSKDAEASVKLTVEENTQDVFVVPATVDFAKGQDTTSFVIKFPKAQIDSTYNLFITMDSVVSNPYREELPSFALTLTVAKWDDVNTKAVVFDEFIDIFFGTGNPGWYCPYQIKNNADGSFDIRLLNPYTILPEYDMDKDPEKPYDYPIYDEFGIYAGYPYNYPTDVDPNGTYNMVIHVAKDGSATFDMFALGMNWGYGMFYGAYNADGGQGRYDATDKSITFPAGTMLSAMADYKNGAFYESEVPVAIYLDSALWQDINSVITIEKLEDGFNDVSLEWNAMAGDLQTVVSAVESDSWETLLLNCIDPNEKEKQGEGSDFFNLYMLTDMYAQGYGLAFYWDTIKGKVSLPIIPQPMGQKFASKAMFVTPSAENESYVEEIELKGDKVKVFHLFLQVQTADGGNLGEYEELFYYGPNAVVWEKADYIGQFVMAGYSPFDGSEVEQAIEIQEKGADLIILGVEDVDTIFASFDDKESALIIEPQMLPNQVEYEGEKFDLALYTLDQDFTPGATAAIKFALKLDGKAAITADSEGIGYLVKAEGLGWWDGMYDMELIPAAPDKEAISRHQNVGPRKLASNLKSTRTNRQKKQWTIIGRVPAHNYRLLK